MIEVDEKVLLRPEDEDYESTGYDTSTASLTSSVQKYLFENGRRYHAYYGTDKYIQPTDEIEQDRLDLHHEIQRLGLNNKLHEAPLTEPHRILDIGTGTGIWAIDMADRYPMAEVIGIDLSPIQPSWVPANCRFEVDDAMQDWTFKSNWFDLIHIRNCSTGISNWDHLASEMYRCTASGGYVELCEADMGIHCDDGTMADDNPLKIYAGNLQSSFIQMDRPPRDMEFYENLIKKAGFEDVKISVGKEPVGPWPKDPTMKKIGAMTLLHCETVFESYGMAAFTRVLGMDAKDAKILCDNARAAARNKNYHAYFQHFRVYGRKPATETK
ncbi:S-adenosyl-L-methionine-dependent methyltransferase [Pyronema domesticum]|nr:S-adenosyl-L-methionine-dependent methyltransferase [Pyronema domesticum]